MYMRLTALAKQEILTVDAYYSDYIGVVVEDEETRINEHMFEIGRYQKYRSTVQGEFLQPFVIETVDLM